MFGRARCVARLRFGGRSQARVGLRLCRLRLKGCSAVVFDDVPVKVVLLVSGRACRRQLDVVVAADRRELGFAFDELDAVYVGAFECAQLVPVPGLQPQRGDVAARNRRPACEATPDEPRVGRGSAGRRNRPRVGFRMTCGESAEVLGVCDGFGEQDADVFVVELVDRLAALAFAGDQPEVA
jgi:hypothetical protein